MDDLVTKISNLAIILVPALLILYLRDKRKKSIKLETIEKFKADFYTNKELLIYRKGDGLIGTSSIIFFLGGLFGLTEGEVVIGLSSTLFGMLGICLFLYLYKYVNKQPYLIINLEGLIHPYIGFIPWADIYDIQYVVVSSRYNIHNMTLSIKNIEQYLLNAPKWQKLFRLSKSSNVGVNIGSLILEPSLIYSVSQDFKTLNEKPNKSLNLTSANDAPSS